MQEAVLVHRHPMSGEKILGRRLEPGDVVEETDVYDSTSGRWEKVPIPSATIREGAIVYFVRPDIGLS